MGCSARTGRAATTRRSGPSPRRGRRSALRRRISSAWEPCSTMRPSSITTIRSASRMVERRWAMTIAVRPAMHGAHRLLDRALAAQVDRGGRLVQDQAGAGRPRAPGRSTGSWRWPAESRAPRSSIWVSRPSGRSVDEVHRTDRRAGGDELGVARGRPGEAQVVGDRPAEEVALLGHDPELRAQRALSDRAQVVPVDAHDAGVGVVEAGDQLGERALAGAGRADEGHGLAGGDPEAHVVRSPAAPACSRS